MREATHFGSRAGNGRLVAKDLARTIPPFLPPRPLVASSPRGRSLATPERNPLLLKTASCQCSYLSNSNKMNGLHHPKLEDIDEETLNSGAEGYVFPR